MMLLHSYLHDTHERPDIARLKRVYKLYCGGLFKTCRYGEAIILLQTGKWFDKTNYLPNEEVLTYEKPRQWICSGQSEETSEREEPGHQQHNPNIQKHCTGKESGIEGNGVRSTRSEVKKRGRPKVVK
jgi:hypothetical protein